MGETREVQVTPYRDPTAVVGRRIVAYIIDSIIVFGLTLVAFFVLAESDPEAFDDDQVESINAAFGQFADDDSSFQSAWDLGEAAGGFISFDEDDFSVDIRIVEGGSFWAVNAIGVGAGLLLLVVLQGATGKTPGKALLGITTVAADGSPPGIGRAVVRWLLLIVDAFCILPGLITSLVSKGHRRIGDMAAGTYVVRADAAGQPVQLDAPAPAYTASAYPPQAPTTGGQPAADAQWDAARQAWIRWDGTAWTQYDPSVPGGWRPIS